MHPYRILLFPDGLEGGGAPAPEPSPVVVDTPLSDPNTDTIDLGSTTSGQPSPDTSVSAPASPAPTQSAREIAASLGFDTSRFADDRQFLAALTQRANANSQADYYAQLGRQMVPHATQFQQYLQAQQAPQAPAERPTWQPPELDERFLQLVDRDPNTGVYVPKPGVPQEIAQQVNARASWERDFNRNPAAMIGPMVEQRASEIAEQLINERFGQQERNSAAQQIIAANSSWLHQPGQVGTNGRPVLSPLGARYHSHVQSLERNGMSDPRAIDLYARQAIQAEMFQYEQSQKVNPAAATQAALAESRGNTNPLQANGSQQRTGNPAATNPSQVGLTLSQRMARDLAANNIKDADFLQDS